jgi:DNA-binding NarL/FixJ family response regulator
MSKNTSARSGGSSSRICLNLRVLVADDHALIRQGLRQIVSSTPDIKVGAEAENGVQVIQLLRNEHFDVVVMDISMPERNGLETLKILRREHPRLPTLILSMHEEAHYAVRSIRAGALGYLCKHAAAENLIEAIRTVASGKRFLSPVVADHLANAVLSENEGEGLCHEKLSDREYQTLCLIASGHTLSEIAACMKLSVKTVSVYRSRLLEKMKLRTNAELTYYGVKHGLVAGMLADRPQSGAGVSRDPVV